MPLDKGDILVANSGVTVYEKNSLNARINNEKFMANAKPELIQQTKDRIEEITIQEKTINELINSLNG